MPLRMLWHVRVVLCKLMAILTNGIMVILIVKLCLLILRVGWHTFVKPKVRLWHILLCSMDLTSRMPK